MLGGWLGGWVVGFGVWLVVGWSGWMVGQMFSIFHLLLVLFSCLVSFRLWILVFRSY